MRRHGAESIRYIQQLYNCIPPFCCCYAHTHGSRTHQALHNIRLAYSTIQDTLEEVTTAPLYRVHLIHFQSRPYLYLYQHHGFGTKPHRRSAAVHPDGRSTTGYTTDSRQSLPERRCSSPVDSGRIVFGQVHSKGTSAVCRAWRVFLCCRLRLHCGMAWYDVAGGRTKWTASVVSLFL